MPDSTKPEFDFGKLVKDDMLLIFYTLTAFMSDLRERNLGVNGGFGIDGGKITLFMERELNDDEKKEILKIFTDAFIAFEVYPVERQDGFKG